MRCQCCFASRAGCNIRLPKSRLLDGRMVTADGCLAALRRAATVHRHGQQRRSSDRRDRTAPLCLAGMGGDVGQGVGVRNLAFDFGIEGGRARPGGSGLLGSESRARSLLPAASATVRTVHASPICRASFVISLDGGVVSVEPRGNLR